MTDVAAGHYVLKQPSFGGSRRADPSRAVGLGFVLLLHVAIIYALALSLSHSTSTILHAPIQMRVFDQAKREETRPPPPPKFVEPPPTYVPVPEIAIQSSAAPTTAIQATTTKPEAVAPAPPPPPAPVKQVRVEPDLDTAASREPDYPAMSRRMGEQGLVSLLVLVAPDGSVQDVRLEKSSGSNRLDEAAIAGAKNRSHFKPGSIDGKPSAMWFRYRYEFHLS